MVKDYPVVSQGMTSGGALAAAPIAQKAGVPIAIIFAGAPGIVETGDFVYRANAPQPTYHHLLAEHFKNQGVKTVAQVYNNDVPTNETLAEETWPELAKTNGFEITSSDGVGATATNFSSIVSKITSANPDAVVMHLTGAQHVTFATALKRAGYQGKVAGGAGLGAGILKPMGDQADGILFPIDFSAANPDPKIKKFVDAYKAKYNEDPSPYAADAYDAMQLITKSLAASNSFESEDIKAGMEKVAGRGLRRRRRRDHLREPGRPRPRRARRVARRQGERDPALAGRDMRSRRVWLLARRLRKCRRARIAPRCRSPGRLDRRSDMHIICSHFITLDGVVQAPGGPQEDIDGGFAHGAPA